MITHKGTLEVRTERLLLRKVRLEDDASVYRWMSDPQVCKYERWEPHENIKYSRGYINEVFDYKTKKTYLWGIQLGDSLIGSISIVNVDEHDRKATLGYCLARDYWSKGYTTEAVKAVIKFILQDIGLNRIEASCSVNNKSSIRVLEKAGFALEGHAKDYYFCNAGFQDSNLYAITKASFVE